MVEQIVDAKLTDFQLQLGISVGGFGQHSPVHMCRAANLASSLATKSRKRKYPFQQFGYIP